jgi:hypothetical protein
MKMKKLPSEANSEKGDLSGEGRLGENRELMDKNRIEGRHGASRGHNTPKTIGMPVEVNPAAVRWSNVQLPGEISPSQDGEKSAEVIVVGKTSRGQVCPFKHRNRRFACVPLRPCQGAFSSSGKCFFLVPVVLVEEY